jgi:hypothetical protein
VIGKSYESPYSTQARRALQETVVEAMAASVARDLVDFTIYGA